LAERTCANRVAKGEALYRRALEIIPGGTQTNAKRPPEALQGAYPPFIVRGQGAYVWDVDGNRYIDHKLGCGPVILGHAYPRSVEAATRQLQDGLVYGSAHPSEVELAELIIETVPCAEMVRFLKTGAEGTSAAVRLARTLTGRELLVSSGYHGWHDWGMAKTRTVAGIPRCTSDLTADLPFGDYARLDSLFTEWGSDIAALIISSPYDQEVAAIRDFYLRARDLTRAHGALLIFDEIVTGFRVSLGGIQELTGVTPDLAVFSKGMANGFPIAAVTGSREAMGAWNKTTISATFGGEAVSIAASIACIQELREKGVPAVIARRGAWLKREAERIGQLAGLPLRGLGFDALPMIVFEPPDNVTGTALQRALLCEGVFPYWPLWYISYSHDAAVLAETTNALERATRRVREGR
jgi:glutamate-1-semialdehyde aminotransferase